MKPPEWTNDNIMAIMFSELPDNSFNNDEYNTILSFWCSAIQCYLSSTHSLCFTIEQLRCYYRRPNGLIPVFLEQIIKVLVNNGTVLDMSSSYSTFGFLVDWLIGADDRLIGPFYCEKRLDNIANILLDIARKTSTSRSGCIFSINNFHILIRKAVSIFDSKSDVPVLSHLDYNLLIENLSKQKKIYRFMYDGMQFIKIASSCPDSVDMAIAGLKTASDKLKDQETTIQSRIECYMKRAKKSLQTKNRSAAKLLVSSVQQLRQSLDSRISARINVEKTLLAIEEFDINKQITQALNLSSKALQDLNTIFDEAIALSDTISVQIQEQEELSLALAQPLTDDDATSLEKELDQLSLCDYDSILDLPSVPVNTPEIIVNESKEVVLE